MTGTFNQNLSVRHVRGSRWQAAFALATILAVAFLATLVLTIVDDAFGWVIMMDETDRRELTRDGVTLDAQNTAQLLATIDEHLSPRRYRALERELPFADRGRDDLYALVLAEIVNPEIAETYNLFESLVSAPAIKVRAAEEYPEGLLVFRSWVNARFLLAPQSAVPLAAGIKTAILGTLMTILITLAFAFPIGIGAAIWLEEYARDSWLTRAIQVNIYNLAGVPSIIYGMLGLAVFVRGLEPITSGAIFGASAAGDTANGRTILSAGLTLAVLILPVIIINAQEALKAVPGSLRQSSLAVGATKWQTIRYHVLPASFDRILTGTVLAISRAIGETAPLVVIGASTFLTQDPTSIFSKFTTLPIQIYQWTSRPQAEFRHLAAAAIVVLLALMLSLNSFAIVARNKMRKQKRF